MGFKAEKVDIETTVDDRPVPERLLIAAMELLQTQGLQTMSQARVAAKAGLRQSHLTYYFPTRKDLIKALVETIYAELEDAIDIAIHKDNATITSVEKAREFFAERVREPILARLMLALMNAADEDPSLKHWIQSFDEKLKDRIAQILSSLGLRITRDEIALLHASFAGIAIMSANDDSDTGKANAARLIRMSFDKMVDNALPHS